MDPERPAYFDIAANIAGTTLERAESSTVEYVSRTSCV